ncbi:hypothetical protein IW138_005216 [Coemansia sp. RSA 986]|nr:hypothetical protein IW138_005216 [Coemansia sp. RSA 986]
MKAVNLAAAAAAAEVLAEQICVMGNYNHKPLHGKTTLAKNSAQTGYVGYILLIVPSTNALIKRRVQTVDSLVYFVSHSGITSIR